jgi:hypothetical protein
LRVSTTRTFRVCSFRRKGPVPIMRFLRSPSSSSTSRENITVIGSATFCGKSTLGVLRWTRTVYLSGVSTPSTSWKVNDCTPSFA